MKPHILSRYDRKLRECQLIRLRLYGSPNLLEDFPSRPKGMRWARYLKLQKTEDPLGPRNSAGGTSPDAFTFEEELSAPNVSFR